MSIGRTPPGHHRQAATRYIKEDDMYRELLKKYICHVGNVEGVTFLGECYNSTFTPEEWVQLKRLETENKKPCELAIKIAKQLWNELEYTNIRHYSLFEKIVSRKIDEYIGACRFLRDEITNPKGGNIIEQLKHLFAEDK